MATSEFFVDFFSLKSKHLNAGIPSGSLLLLLPILPGQVQSSGMQPLWALAPGALPMPKRVSRTGRCRWRFRRTSRRTSGRSPVGLWLSPEAQRVLAAEFHQSGCVIFCTSDWLSQA